MDVNNFSERAREAIETAQGVVRRGSGNVLGTEHLLIGVLSLPGGVVEQILNALGIDKGVLMTRADQMAQNQPAGTSGPSGPAEMLYMTPRAKAALDLAVQEAQKLGDEFVGTEHLLLGHLPRGRGPGQRHPARRRHHRGRAAPRAGAGARQRRRLRGHGHAARACSRSTRATSRPWRARASWTR